MQLASVQALRGLAALAVVFFHFRIYLSEGSSLRDALQYGKYGVDAFFVLSGFVLCHSLFHNNYNWQMYGRFLWKRIARLEPPYLLSIALLLGLRWFTFRFSPFTQQTSFEIDGWNLLYHLGYLVPWIDGKWLNSVYWTLAVEFQFYLILGLIFPFFLHGFRPFRLLFVLFWLALAFLPLSDIYCTHYALLFGLGMVWLMEKEWLIMPMIARFLIVLILIGISLQFGWASFFAAALTYLLGRFWQSVPRFLVKLGDYSYGLYLLHIPLGATFLLQFGCRFVSGDFWVILMMLGTTGICILASAAMYQWVEKRCKVGW